MRVWWWLLSLVIVVSLCSDTNAQLNVGPNGLSTPPINLLSVFKFLREIFNAYMYPDEPTTAQSKKSGSASELPVESREGTLEEGVKVMGFDTEGNIVEKFDSGCDDETNECVTVLPEDLYGNPENRTQEDLQDKTATTQLVLGKWPILYIVFIITLAWLLIVIASPYVIAGESIGRKEDDPYEYNLIDQQDVYLLLAFLLGEVSDDNACLERVVCVTPSKSSNYITITSMMFKLAKFFESWGGPYSRRYEDLMVRLGDVAHDGFSQECDQYYCPTVPDI